MKLAATKLPSESHARCNKSFCQHLESNARPQPLNPETKMLHPLMPLSQALKRVKLQALRPKVSAVVILIMYPHISSLSLSLSLSLCIHISIHTSCAYMHMYLHVLLYDYIDRYVYTHMGRCQKERLQKEDKGGHIMLESIISSLRYKAGPQIALLNFKGGARFALEK